MTSTTSTTGSEIDRQAVLDVLKGVYDAEGVNDAEAFVSDYLDDASSVQPGIYKKNQHEIQTTIGAAFAGPLKGSPVIDHPVGVRFLNGDAAIVISEVGSSSPDRKRFPPRRCSALRPAPCHTRRSPRLGPRQSEEAGGLNLAGQSLANLSERFGDATDTVTFALRRAGVTLRSRQGWVAPSLADPNSSSNS